MNCKPGDMAIVVRVAPKTLSALGKVVTVSRAHRYVNERGVETAAWEYEPQMKIGDYAVTVVEDCCLRPLRDMPGQDEVLTIAGKPIKEAA